MKIRRVKTLIALLFGLSGLGVSISPAVAGDNNALRCKGELVNACGVSVVKTYCAGVKVDGSTKDVDDSSHDPHAKDSEGKDDKDHNRDSQKDHLDRTASTEAGKVAICHRMGGAEVSVVVANDGWMSGHIKHPLDTIGRCTDFEAQKTTDDAHTDEASKDREMSISDKGFNLKLSTTQIACLKGSPDRTYTINGVPYKGAGFNSPDFSFSLQSASHGPSRGGARTLH